MRLNQKQKDGYEYYVIQKKTAKESARLCRTTEKTFGNWVKKFNWKNRRDALLTSEENGLENLLELLDLYTEKLLELERDPTSDTKEKFLLTNQLANLRKLKADFEKDNKIPYTTYVNVADGLMTKLVKNFPKQKEELLDWFEEYLTELGTKY